MRERILMGVARGGIKTKEDTLVLVFKEALTYSLLTTQNHLKSGSVRLCEENYKKNNKLKAIVVISGNANALTGRDYEDAKFLVKELSRLIGCREEETLIFTTGVIGKPLPLNSLRESLKVALKNLKEIDLKRASEVISTTDRFPKFFEYKGKFNLLTFAKGAGMIMPHMATMLCFTFTDAKVKNLREIHRKVNEETFNSISVDNCQSTNDCFLLATFEEVEVEEEEFERVLRQSSLKVAKDIVRDGEGATKLIEVLVEGARSKVKARELSKAVASSILLKTALFGNDPNWGRVLSALGSTEFSIPKDFKLYFGDLLVYHLRPVADEKKLREYLEKNEEVKIRVVLNEGNFSWRYYTCDLTYDYVKLNSEYHT